MNQLEQLASLTTIVADTGDIASIAKIQPQDATTNPSLILKASKDPAYRAFLTEAVENSVSLEDAHKLKLLTHAETKELYSLFFDDKRKQRIEEI